MQQMMGGVMMHGPRPQMPPHSVANTQGPPAGPPVPGEDAPPLPSEPPPPDEVVFSFNIKKITCDCVNVLVLFFCIYNVVTTSLRISL